MIYMLQAEKLVRYIFDMSESPGLGAQLEGPNGDQEAEEEIMREQDYVGRAKLSPARTFESPMDVVETNDIERVDKLAILKAWEADEVALLRAEDEGMGGGEHAHLQKVRAALEYLSAELG